MTTTTKLSAMVRAYLACALFTLTNDDGEPLDRQYDVGDFAPEAVAKVQADCDTFLAQVNADDRTEYNDRTFDPDGIGPESMMGHDLWLTRNGHGAGFWDRGLGELGDRLSILAEWMGECDVYAGDDGRLYFS